MDRWQHFWIMEDTRRTFADMDVSKAVSAIEKGSSSSVFNALVYFRTKVIKTKEGVDSLRHFGGIKALLSVLRQPAQKIVDIALSILGNCCMDQKIRIEVRRLGGIHTLVSILKNIVVESIQNRVVRTLANMALDADNVGLLFELEVLEDIIKLLNTTQNTECQMTYIRAIRILGSRPEHRDTVCEADGLYSVAKLLKSVHNGVKSGCLRTVFEFSDKCSAACAGQLIMADAFTDLVQLVITDNPESSQNSVQALTSLLNVCSVANARPSVGNAGGISCFISLIKNANLKVTNKLFPVVNALCLCCHESVNRMKIRDEGGLELLLDILQSDVYTQVHNIILSTLVCFIYDEASIEVLLRSDLVAILMHHLVQATGITEVHIGDFIDNGAVADEKLKTKLNTKLKTDGESEKIDGFTEKETEKLISSDSISLETGTKLGGGDSASLLTTNDDPQSKPTTGETNVNQTDTSSVPSDQLPLLPVRFVADHKGMHRVHSDSELDQMRKQNQAENLNLAKQTMLGCISAVGDVGTDDNTCDLDSSSTDLPNRSQQAFLPHSPPPVRFSSVSPPLSTRSISPAVSYVSPEWSPEYNWSSFEPQFSPLQSSTYSSAYSPHWSPTRGHMSPQWSPCSSPNSPAPDLPSLFPELEDARYSSTEDECEEQQPGLSFQNEKQADKAECSESNTNLLPQNSKEAETFPEQEGKGGSEMTKRKKQKLKLKRMKTPHIDFDALLLSPKSKSEPSTPVTPKQSTRSADENILIILSRISQINDPSEHLCTTEVLETLLTYGSQVTGENLRWFRIMNRITCHPLCFQCLVTNFVPCLIYNYLVGGYALHNQKTEHKSSSANKEGSVMENAPHNQSTKCTLSSEEGCNAGGESEFKIGNKMGISDVAKEGNNQIGKSGTNMGILTSETNSFYSPDTSCGDCRSDDDVKALVEHGNTLLGNLYFQAESLYGQGVLSHILLKGSDQQKRHAAVSLPYICRSNSKLRRKFLHQYSGLSHLLDGLISVSDEDDQLFQMTCMSLRYLIQQLDLNISSSGIRFCDQESQGCVLENRSTNLTFILEDRSQIEASREIMVRSSEVFSAMLEGHYSESTQSKVGIEEVSTPAFLHVVHSLHGCVRCAAVLSNEDTFDKDLEVLLLSDRYMLQTVQRKIVSAITDVHLNKVHVYSIYSYTSRIHDCDVLKQQCLKYLLVGTMSLVDRITLFKQFFSSPLLRDQVSKEMFDILIELI